MSARSHRLEHSLGSSWGEADYASGDEGSVNSASEEASEVELEGSDKEIIQEPQTITTPRPKRANLSQSTPTARTQVRSIRKPASRTKVSQSQRIGSDRRTPKQDAFEPSLIMPSMANSPSGYNGSLGTKSQPRNRARNSAPNPVSNSPGPSGNSPMKDSGNEHSHWSSQEQEEVSPWHYVSLFWDNVAAPLLAHFLDILSYALRHFIKPALGVMLGLGILVFSIQIASSMLRSTVSNAVMGPVCAIPGSSYLIAACTTTGPSPQADFEELINVQSRFEDILDASKDTSALPATIKNSELAIRDLRILVKHSRLPSRKALDNEFEYFVQTANEASVDLSRYNSRIGGAVDRVIATNTWTMNVLSGISEKEASIGAVGRIVNQLTGAFVAPPPTLQQRVFDQYLLHVSKNKDEITGLIETAQALLHVLQNLDERLDTILSIATGDDRTISDKQDELLSSLWTKLGGNRGDVKANAKSLNLLSNISAYRKKAVIHVSDTLLKLQEIQAELENLREGVAAPEILGYRSDVPLEYHIEYIGKGVERLQISRGEQMSVERDTYKRLMRGGEEAEGRRELPGPTVTVRAK